MTNYLVGGFVATIITLYIPNCLALQCWDCSSDIDRRCGDPFNFTDMLNQRGGGNYYDNLQQNYNQQNQNQRNYDPQRSNYDQNYNNQGYNNQGYNNQPGSYNPNYQNQRTFQDFNRQSRNYPTLRTCDENDARGTRQKMICIKKVTKRGGSFATVSRRCEKVNFDQRPGTCNDPVNPGISLEFCEYCDYDGCNSANTYKTNIVIACLVPLLCFVLSYM